MVNAISSSLKSVRITLLSCPETFFGPSRAEISDFDSGPSSSNPRILFVNDSGCDSGLPVVSGVAADLGKMTVNQCSDTSMWGSAAPYSRHRLRIRLMPEPICSSTSNRLGRGTQSGNGSRQGVKSEPKFFPGQWPCRCAPFLRLSSTGTYLAARGGLSISGTISWTAAV